MQTKKNQQRCRRPPFEFQKSTVDSLHKYSDVFRSMKIIQEETKNIIIRIRVGHVDRPLVPNSPPPKKKTANQKRVENIVQNYPKYKETKDISSHDRGCLII